MILIITLLSESIFFQTTPGSNSITLNPGHYLIESFRSQRKSEIFHQNQKNFQGQHLTTSLIIEGSPQSFTSFLGYQHSLNSKSTDSHQIKASQNEELPEAIIFTLDLKDENFLISYLDFDSLPNTPQFSRMQASTNSKEQLSNTYCLDQEKVVQNDGNVIRFCTAKHETSNKLDYDFLQIKSLFQCPQNCQKCSSSETCEQCRPNYEFDPIQNQCILSCPTGEYRIGNACQPIENLDNITSQIMSQKSLSGILGPCDRGTYRCGLTCCPCSDKLTNCNDCQFGGRNPDCIECSPGYYLDGGKCYKCHSSCATCSGSASQCDSCRDGLFLRRNACFACDKSCQTCTESGNTNCNNCANGYYKNGNACVKCHQNCATCTGGNINQCKTCPSGKIFSNGQCLCPKGQYLDPYVFTCQKCHKRCKECEDSTYAKCNGCNDGYYQSGSYCNLCHPNCATCSGQNSNQCLTCDNTKQISNGYCVCKQSNQYLDGTTCKNCDSPCTKCEAGGNTQCSECIEGYYLDNQHRCRVITNTFTPSSVFTPSFSFTSSQNFSKSLSFTESISFSESVAFSTSQYFSQSEDFEATSKFSNSIEFSKSFSFTNSQVFSKSSPFTNSLTFTFSSVFSKSNEFEPTNSFSSSNSFSESSTLVFETTPVDTGVEEEVSTSEEKSSSNKMLTIGLIVAGLVVIAVVVVLILLVLFRKKKNQSTDFEQSVEATAYNMTSNITAQTEDSFDSINSMIQNDPFLNQIEETIQF